jgi:outer membrane protein, multidrug efflux system
MKRGIRLGIKHHITRHTQTALALATTALLVGCAGWGPKTPPAALPSAPAAAQFAHAAATTDQPVQQFWRLFNDSTLDSLVSQALVSNTDLRVAVARVAEARALAQGSDGLGRPTLGVGGGVSRARTGNGTDASSRTANNFNAGLQAGWEPDLFGRIRSEKTAAQAQLQTTQAQQRAVQVSVVAEVARTYFELRGQQEQLRVARAALQTQTEALKIVQARLDGGRGTALDTERAQALVASTAAAVPALDAARVRSHLRLATLTGLAPNILPTALNETRPLPALPAMALANIGSPQTLLQRRPDVAAAEAQLRATQAQWGVAQSALYPRITLAGSLGLNAGRLVDVLEPTAFVFNLGAQLLYSLVDNGQRQAQVGAAAARINAAQATFDQAVLLALEDTEAALASYTRAQQQTDSLFAAATAANRAARIARARFGAGVSDFFAVLDAERELLAAQDRLAAAQTQAATALVAVYRALAGGWGEEAAPSGPPAGG